MIIFQVYFLSQYHSNAQYIMARRTHVLKTHTLHNRARQQMNQIFQNRETALQGGIVLAKSGTVELGDNIMRTMDIMSIFNHSDVIGQQCYRIRWKKCQIGAIRPFKVIQSHRRRYQSKAHTCDFLLVINTNWHILVPFRCYRIMYCTRSVRLLTRLPVPCLHLTQKVKSSTEPKITGEIS